MRGPNMVDQPIFFFDEHGKAILVRIRIEHRLTSDQWLVGQRLDAKSNLRPSPVQFMSNACPKKGLVVGLSRPGPSTVQALSNVCQDQ